MISLSLGSSSINGKNLTIPHGARRLNECIWMNSHNECSNALGSAKYSPY
jgi:hypothetical protein